jgi:hypothetical protein
VRILLCLKSQSGQPLGENEGMEWKSKASIALLITKDSRYLAGAKKMIEESFEEEGKYSNLFSVKVIFSNEVSREEISTALAIVFLIEADRGISNEEIDTFLQLRDMQLPTLILVAGLDLQTQDFNEESVERLGLLDQSSWDFDDMVMLCNRVLEPVVAPYLVLHHEDGHPSGYFDLESSEVIEYRDGERITRASDKELLEVVEEFQNEFNQSGYVVSDFLQGNSVLAIPYIPERGMGKAEVNELLTKLLKAQP